MTVSDLIELLEEIPPDIHVVVDNAEATQVLLRDEVYFSEDMNYKEGLIVKIY